MPEERILVIDDDENIGKLCEEILHKEGFTTDFCDNGMDALKMLERNIYNLAILDIKLPDIDGIVLLTDIKKKHKKTDVIIITGHGDMKSVLDSMRAGAYDYIQKPFQKEDLIIPVKRSIEKQSLSNEITELKKMDALYKISKAMSSVMELASLLDLIMKSALTALNADSGSLMLVDKDGKTMTLTATAGLDEDKIESHKIKIGEGVSGWVAAKGKPLLLLGGLEDYPQFSHIKSRKEINSAISVPLKIRNKLIGVLNVNNIKSKSDFSHEDMKLLIILAGDAALAINNASLLESAEKKVAKLEKKIIRKEEKKINN